MLAAMLAPVLETLRDRTRRAQVPAPIDATRFQCLGEFLHDALLRFKSEVALIEQRRKAPARSWTYQAFRDEAEAIISALNVHHIGPGDRVAILMANQPRWLLAAYAVFHRGGVLVPLDYKLDADEQQKLLHHASAKVLFIDRSLLKRFERHPDVGLVVESDDTGNSGLPLLAGPQIQWETFRETGSAVPPLVMRQRNDLACIVYSSGTGGTPKGCMLSHGNYLAQYEALRELVPLHAGHRYFSILPTNHAIDFMCGFVGPLASGATVVHQRTLRPDMIRHTLKEQRITHMAVVPVILEALGRALEERIEALDTPRRSVLETLATIHGSLTARRPSRTLSRALLASVHQEFGGALETIFCGGAFVEPHYPNLFQRFGIPVMIGYGLTEACTVVTLNDLSPFRADSVGRPVPGTKVVIRDPNHEGIGEVLVKGPTVMKGYLDAETLTGETVDDDGYLHTGDLGSFDASGHLKLVGRKKNVIVTAGGKNVYPEDVESAFQALDQDELVVASTGYVWGGNLSEEYLFVVTRTTTSQEEFLQNLEQTNRKLPQHKRVRGVLFVDDPFPRTASMKIKREALMDQLRKKAAF